MNAYKAGTGFYVLQNEEETVQRIFSNTDYSEAIDALHDAQEREPKSTWYMMRVEARTFITLKARK